MRNLKIIIRGKGLGKIISKYISKYKVEILILIKLKIFKMSSRKTSVIKRILNERGSSRTRAPVWVFLKTKKVRDSPQSHKNWKNTSIF